MKKGDQAYLRDDHGDVIPVVIDSDEGWEPLLREFHYVVPLFPGDALWRRIRAPVSSLSAERQFDLGLDQDDEGFHEVTA